MKYIFSISLFALLLMNCNLTSTLKQKHVVWESIVKGNVKIIYYSKYSQTANYILQYRNSISGKAIPLELSDSTIAFFSEEKLLTRSKTLCNEELEQGNISNPCSERLLEYDKKNRLKGSEYIDFLSDYTTYSKVKKYNEQQLPYLIETVDEKGNIVGLTHYEFNPNGLVTRRTSEYENLDLKITITNEYTQDGLVVKVTSEHDNRQADEQDLPIPKENTTSIVYKYLEFDKKGNWTKRKEIKNDSIVSFSYQVYEYYK